MHDYFSEFLKEELTKTVKLLWTFIASLCGGIIPYIIMFFNDQNLPNEEKFISFKWLLILILTTLFIFIMILFFRLVKFQINIYIRNFEIEKTKMSNQIKELTEHNVIPLHLTIEDVSSYIILETSMDKKYTLNQECTCFDVSCELYFKVKGCKKEISFIETKYNSGFWEYKPDAFYNMKKRLKNDQSGSYKLNLNCVTSTRFEHIMRVEFENMNLKQNDIVEYTIILDYPEYQFLSKEEMDFYGKKKIFSPIEYLSTTRTIDMLGIKILNISISFPANYIVNKANFAVITKSDSVVHEEIKRLRDSFVDSQSSHFNNLRLKVENPIVGLQYKINWQPPRLITLKEKAFLSEDQYNKLVLETKNT